ncbi:MAG: FixH family protein [Myxococcales bacterium]|nr:FixH family protein [Myxococcales bacterium]MDD9969694.1 FixH family protein [Myxococcales bacterium]
MYLPFVYLLVALSASQLLACDDSSDQAGANVPTAGNGDGDSATNPDAPTAGSNTDDLPAAPCKVQPEDFALDQTTMSEGGLFAVKIVGAEPAPPAKFDNAWDVQIVGPTGDPMEGATIKEVKPWMPAHGHGAGYVPMVTATEAGAFNVDPLYLWMSGGWTVTFTVEVGGQAEDAVVDVCIPQ